jgi:hypothetical protein
MLLSKPERAGDTDVWPDRSLRILNGVPAIGASSEASSHDKPLSGKTGVSVSGGMSVRALIKANIKAVEFCSAASGFSAIAAADFRPAPYRRIHKGVFKS